MEEIVNSFAECLAPRLRAALTQSVWAPTPRLLTLSVVGNIGVGKSTLLDEMEWYIEKMPAQRPEFRELFSNLEFVFIKEPVEAFKDIFRIFRTNKMAAGPWQIANLVHFEAHTIDVEHRATALAPGKTLVVIFERSPLCIEHVFGPLQHADITLSHGEVLRSMLVDVKRSVVWEDAIYLYLHCDASSLGGRVEERGREFENSSDAYRDAIEDRYRTMIEEIPTKCVDANVHDLMVWEMRGLAMRLANCIANQLLEERRGPPGRN